MSENKVLLPKSVINITALEIVIRGLIAVLTPEQMRLFNTFLEGSLKHINEDPEASIENLSELTDAVIQLSSHIKP
ncbi:hypothetical protein PGS49_09250 [Yersinia intermedia]|uniref:hypothetical protein n=1 Tax=Yersinia intermedia TaxID=631 RepID=UPI0022FDFF3A|nr:hypothetical protein [Yersinia intermedia]MDA5480844.1 hypothetical protein [Yersinia intermedia]